MTTAHPSLFPRVLSRRKLICCSRCTRRRESQLRFLASKEPRFDAAAKIETNGNGGDLLAAVYVDTPPSVGSFIR